MPSFGFWGLISNALIYWLCKELAMAGRTNPTTGEITGHINVKVETHPMKTMNPEVLDTQYAVLTVDLVKIMLAQSHGEISPQRTVEYAITLADEIVLQLDQREKAAKALAEAARVILPVDWSCGPDDDANRSGQHWSQPEVDALVAQYKNGRTGSEIAVHHRRTWTAVSAQLAKYGFLRNTGGGSYERSTGDTWDL